MSQTSQERGPDAGQGAEAIGAKRILILWGGWEGHEPGPATEWFAGRLAEMGHRVVRENSLAPLEDREGLGAFDLIFPCWTMGELPPSASENLRGAVEKGTGLGGFHGGMGDAFRGDLWYQWMVGGQFVRHPPGMLDYSVRVLRPDHPIVAGMGREFAYRSEIYHMMVDPSIEVLAETDYPEKGQGAGGTFAVPVVWTKRWGAGRVFYSALGHCLREFVEFPAVADMTLRGLLWAAR